MCVDDRSDRLCSLCARTGGDPNESGTELHLQPAGPLRRPAQQITGGRLLMFPLRCAFSANSRSFNIVWQTVNLIIKCNPVIYDLGGGRG